MNTLILYHTKTGHTLEAINPLVKGIIEAGGQAETILAEEFKIETLKNYDSLIVASPCWGGSSGITGVAFPLVNILKKLPSDSLKDKLCGGVAIHAKYGGKGTLKHIERLLLSKGCINFKIGPVVKAGVLMSLYKGPSVKKSDELILKQFGIEFAHECLK